MSSYRIINADCLDAMAAMEPNSVDSIVTDPPYGLAFMGKDWDHGVPGVHFWQQSLTYHRLACAIEDAGWEVRDCLGWLYGSGFPKSMSISKALDKGQGENRARQLQFTEWMRSTGITADQINGATNSNMASHYLTDKTQPAIATADMFDLLRPYLPEVPEEIERLVAERTGIEWTDYVKREVVGTASVPKGHAFAGETYGFDSSNKDVAITAPATDLARQWDGWGTALKPAREPAILARKPFKGTVAANVIEHGTGGINIDGCRVATDEDMSHGGKQSTELGYHGGTAADGSYATSQHPSGRFPANIMHNGSDEATEPMGEASRFFYCAKASKSDRDDGLDGFANSAPIFGGSVGDGLGRGISNTRQDIPRKNFHPTVKPTDLMAYLCRLITPPNGVVLDPFMGSGSTGKAAVREGFDFIGVDLSAEYCEIAEARIAHEIEKVQNRQPDLFGGYDV